MKYYRERLASLKGRRGRTDSEGERAGLQFEIGLIDNELIKREAELNGLLGVIYGIPEGEIRRIFTLRYLDGCSWRQVAQRLGGSVTEDAPRKRHDRYMGEVYGGQHLLSKNGFNEAKDLAT